MKRILEVLNRKRGDRGQSIVEVAMFLPIFIVILAGLAEVSQIVVAQNRITNASRTGTRFMASGGEDLGMIQVVLNTVTQTLGEDPNRWDMWSIRAKTNISGTNFDEWTFTHVYGLSNTVRAGSVNEAIIYQDVLAELQSQGQQQVADVSIVGTYLLHDVDSILGLDAIPWLAGTSSIKSMSVMRLVGFNSVVTDGCNAFPIAFSDGIRSVNPPGVQPDPFPDIADFGLDSPTRVYTDFPNHVPDQSLFNAKEGYVYKFERGFAHPRFGFLRWNEGRPNDAITLADSLAWPGNSLDYTNNPGTGVTIACPICPAHPVNGFIEAGDLTDVSMHLDDWVAANTVPNPDTPEVRDELGALIDGGNVLRVIVWEHSDVANSAYEIDRFALFRLHGYNLSASPAPWLLAEFIGWDDSCGQKA